MGSNSEVRMRISKVELKNIGPHKNLTVEFGKGNANIPDVLKNLSKINYDQGIIIQGARGKNDLETAKNQLEFTKKIIIDLNIFN